ncbi:MAG: hypothetical protein ABIP94_17230, partial [Planctomycetota bacterium]
VVGCLMLVAAVGLFAWPDSSAPPRASGKPTVAQGSAAPAATVPTAASVPASSDERTTVATASPAPAPTPLLGSVLDVHGNPVAAVEVGMRLLDGAFVALGQSDPMGKVATAPQWPLGQPTVSPPWYLLAVRGPSTRTDGPTPLFVVAPGRALVVTVRDDAGGLLHGTHADVAAYGLVDFPLVLDEASKGNMPRSFAADTGRHRFDLVPIASTTLAIRKPGYLPWTGAIEASTPAEFEVTLRAIEKGLRAITGSVTDARGALVAGATVGLGSRRATTDMYGSYELLLEPGAKIDSEQGLYAVSQGWYPTIVAAFGGKFSASNEPVLVQDLQLLRPSVAISGRLLDHANRPQPNVNVYPWQEANVTDHDSAEDLAAPSDRKPLSLTGNPVRAFDRTDAEGRFTVPGLDRRPYRLRLYEPKLGWGWTTEPIVGGVQDVVVVLPADLMGPVSGVVGARDGTPAAGLAITAYVEVHARDGGVASAGVPIAAKTDEHGRFHFESAPRHGVFLTLDGADWITTSIRLDPTGGTTDLRVVLPRRCHVRVQLSDPKWASAKVSFLDVNDQLVAIHEVRGRLQMIREEHDLHDGKSEVLSVSEAAVAITVQAAGAAELRIPVVLRPGKVTTIAQ